MLKKIRSISYLPLLVFSFFGCSKDDDTVEEQSYTAEISVAGVDQAAHASGFIVTTNTGQTLAFTADDFTNGALKGQLNGLQGLVKLTLVIPESYTRTSAAELEVNQTSKTAQFVVEYEPPVTETPAAINPVSAIYNLLSPSAVTTTITWNSATTVNNISLDGADLAEGDYNVSDNTLTINEEYFEGLELTEGDALEFLIDFDFGASPVAFTVNVASEEEAGAGLLTNYNFEDGLENWTTNAEDRFEVITGGPTNGKMLFYTGGTASAAEIWNVYGDAKPGVTYKVTVSMEVLNFPGGGNFKMRFYNEDNGFLGEDYVDLPADTDGFEDHELTMTAPANTAKLDIMFAIFTEDTNVEVYIDKVVLEEME